MDKKEIEKAAEWFDLRAKNTPMAGARRMFEVAAEVLHEALKAKPQWISVEERLPDPKEYDWVLVNVMDGLDGTFLVPHVAEHRDGDWYNLGEEFSLAELKLSVTHWLPLPEPPKGGE